MDRNPGKGDLFCDLSCLKFGSYKTENGVTDYPGRMLPSIFTL